MWKYFVSCVLFAMLPGAALNQNCMHHSLVEYFNVSQENKLLLYTRPKKNWAEPLEVSLDFTLVSILLVVEKLQVITSYFWLFVKWNNDFVSWNASDFCNITHLTLPADKFWTPEISIEEQANEEKSRISPFVRVSSNGEIMQYQEFHLTSSCSLNIYRFPFDKQKCNITVFSPMHSDEEVVMKMKDITLEVDTKSRNLYLTNGEWKFNSISYSNHIIAGVEMNYSAVTYEGHFRNVEKVSANGVIKSHVISIYFQVPDRRLLEEACHAPAKFFTGIFLLMVVGLLENYLGMYLKEMEPPCWFLKGKSLFVHFRKKKTPVRVLHSEDTIPEEEETCCNHTLVGKDSAEKETYKFLQSICSELQLMRKEVSAQKNQLPADEDWNKFVVLVEKMLCFARTLFSVLFIAYIIQKWIMEI